MHRGSTACDQHFLYFTPRDSSSVYSYQWSTEKWKKRPCPNKESALVIINGQLTAVGGENASGCNSSTNKLFTLRQRQWIEEYPPMNTARSYTTAVSSSDGEYIIVIGGWVGGYRGGWTATGELFQVSSRRWHQLRDLPQPLPLISATICGNQIHVIGREGNGYSGALQALLSNDRPITSRSIVHLISWTSLPRLPVTYSTAATLSGQLVIIGGGWPAVKTIHQLFNGQWVEIGSMSSGRRQCLVVNPSPDKMMIVGGMGSRPREQLDIIEEFVVLYNCGSVMM